MICTPNWTKYFRYEMSFNYNPIKCNHYFKRFYFSLFSFYMYPFLPPHIFVHRLHDWCVERPEEDVESPRTGLYFFASCCGFCGCNMGLLEDSARPLTAEHSFQFLMLLLLIPFPIWEYWNPVNLRSTLPPQSISTTATTQTLTV